MSHYQDPQWRCGTHGTGYNYCWACMIEGRKDLETKLLKAEKLLRRIAGANVIFPSMCANNMEAWNLNEELRQFAAGSRQQEE